MEQKKLVPLSILTSVLECEAVWFSFPLCGQIDSTAPLQKRNQICILWIQVRRCCRWVQCKGGAGWLIARYQEMGSRTDPLANPRSRLENRSILWRHWTAMTGWAEHQLIFPLFLFAQHWNLAWVAGRPIPSSSPPLTACRESLEGWWCPDYIRQMIPSFSHTRHSWLVSHP